MLSVAVSRTLTRCAPAYRSITRAGADGQPTGGVEWEVWL